MTRRAGGYLRRHFGGDGPGLPTAQSVRDCLNVTPYDSAGWNWSSPVATSFRNVLEGWVGPRGIHNAAPLGGRVDAAGHLAQRPRLLPAPLQHRPAVVGLGTEDPAQAPYLPDNTTAAANGLTRLNDLMSSFGRTATRPVFRRRRPPRRRVEQQGDHLYDSDLPELQNETGATLSFVGIPEGLTSYKAVKFKVTGGRPVHFRITGLPAAPFDQTPMGTEFTATPDPNANFYFGYVWVQLAAPGGAVAPSAIDIHAYIVDEEGYYAAVENGEYPLGDFHVTLTATTVPRADNSVCLVLDRSFSMNDPAGGTTTNTSLLRNAVSVFTSLMLPTDEISLDSFDDQVATPAPMAAVNAGTVPPVLAGHDLDLAARPASAAVCCRRHRAGLGHPAQLLHAGAAPTASRTSIRSSASCRPGRSPTAPMRSASPAAGHQRPALNDVTSNTHGDLIITGDISTEEQGFNLTKYFVQVLAGVSRMDVLLDPQGVLLAGSKHVIPFQVTDADVYLDVIALSPLPQILDFTLITPSGDVITPASGGNSDYSVKPQVAFYRVALPALPANPQGSHAGTWQAVLALKSRKDLDKLFKNREFVAVAAGALAGGGLRYSLAAHAYSNLRFEAGLRQDGYRPGATVTLEASLFAYDVPFTGDAAVWADVTMPDAHSLTVALAPLGDGRFDGSFLAGRPGVYPCRVRAEGYFRSKDKFTREKSLTAAIFNGDPGGQGGPNGNDPLCTLLLPDRRGCSVRPLRRLRELGFDGEAFRSAETRPDLGELSLRTPGGSTGRHRLARRCRRAETRAARAPWSATCPEMPLPQPPRHPDVLQDAADDDMAGGKGGARTRRHGRNGRSGETDARQRGPRTLPGRVRRFSKPEEAGPTRDTRSSRSWLPPWSNRAHAGRAHVARA